MHWFMKVSGFYKIILLDNNISPNILTKDTCLDRLCSENDNLFLFFQLVATA